MRWTKSILEIEETIITLLINPGGLSNAAVTTIHRERKLLKSYIEQHPSFLTTHASWPLDVENGMIRDMISASHPFGIGPMASVAGAISLAVLNTVLAAGAEEAIVDNGGDIALYIQYPVRIGIYAGESAAKNLALYIEPRDETFGICTSSGTVGHSYSYGKADAAVVFSKNVLLADAAATALGNRIQDESDLESCFDIFETVPQVEGALAIYRNKISMWGNLPQLVEASVNPDLITRGGLQG